MQSYLLFNLLSEPLYCNGKTKDLDTYELLEQLPDLLQLMFGALGCQGFENGIVSKMLPDVNLVVKNPHILPLIDDNERDHEEQQHPFFLSWEQATPKKLQGGYILYRMLQ
ncbi:hypothetical protein L1987_36548 [Smallanthus sonchifolius]|uniref:Uncharacterized protein n=1 Tax=Smallanthus sonchifolius TaxID=185202 RepID=A0ACB9HFK8_9ASTR|nr:hypothetical protein L1987_36548 [Smallanthus sonchifolius]